MFTYSALCLFLFFTGFDNPWRAYREDDRVAKERCVTSCRYHEPGAELQDF